ncbi:MAG: hypothetical protein ABI867_08175 [Kofleriaceae bacterium]
MRATPSVAFALDREFVVGTDAGAWFVAIEAGVLPLPPTGPFSAAVRDGDRLVVASWEPRLLVLSDRAWTPLDLASPALALAVHARGLVIADGDGGVSVLASGTRVPIQEVTAPAPIVELVALTDSVLALAADGALSVLGSEGALQPIDCTAIGRPHAVFAIDPKTAIVAGARGVAIVNGSRLTAVTTDLPERIRGAAAFRSSDRLCLHDDAGVAWLLGATLGDVVRVRLRDAMFVGVTGGADSLLAWTSDGALHAIHPDGSVAKLATREVALALVEQGHAIAFHAGPRMTRVAWI